MKKWFEHYLAMPCHRAYQREPRSGAPRISYVILHYTAPPLWSAEQYGRALQKSPQQRNRHWSAHFIIDRAKVVQCVPLDMEASHAGDGKLHGKSPNIGSVGIEIVNAGFAVSADEKEVFIGGHRNPAARPTRWQMFSEEQYKLVASVISDISKLFEWPIVILGHEDVSNQDTLGRVGSKLDPGPAFDWDALMNLLQDDTVRRVFWDFEKHELSST